MTSLRHDFARADEMIAPPLASALADELVGLTTMLSDLAYELAGDPETLRRHMHGLQAIDRITQVQMAIAGVLRMSGTVTERLGTVTLEDLAASLEARHAAYAPGEVG